FQLPQGVGVRVVIPGSGAEAAGIRRGDIITKVDDKKVLTIEDLIAEIQKHKVGDSILVEVYNQGNEYKTLRVKLTANND
ncbi:MAG TPA: PDZ domain-containing protein, partial [Candidatus Diapherotrites archaeon]|nr:PDZ domain-containing protein [Candidatus Diapherotrites archaeon]